MADSTIGEGNKRKKEVKYFKCSGCHTIITCEGEMGQKIIVECPDCGKKDVVFTKEKKRNFEKSKRYFSTKKTRLKVPEKITPSKIIWILLEFFVIVTILLLFFVTATGGINIELFFVSIFIGIVVLKELTDQFTPDHLKKKINILISGLLVIFLLIVINEIISLIST